jgi:hypothetical protein
MIKELFEGKSARSLILGEEYQPKTGQKCYCKPGEERDNCPNCEGTGEVIDFKSIRDRNKSKTESWDALNQGLNKKVVSDFFGEVTKEKAKELLDSGTEVFGIDYEGHESKIDTVEDLNRFEMFGIEKK